MLTMEGSLCPRKVPEPTRFPSVIFEPSVPDASLVFGCGLFEAPKKTAEKEKPSQRGRNTEDTSLGGTGAAVLPSWIKAYGVRKDVDADTRQSNRNGCGDRGKAVPEKREIESVASLAEKSTNNFQEKTETAKVSSSYGYRLEERNPIQLQTHSDLPRYHYNEQALPKNSAREERFGTGTKELCEPLHFRPYDCRPRDDRPESLQKNFVVSDNRNSPKSDKVERVLNTSMTNANDPLQSRTYDRVEKKSREPQKGVILPDHSLSDYIVPRTDRPEGGNTNVRTETSDGPHLWTYDRGTESDKCSELPKNCILSDYNLDECTGSGADKRGKEFINVPSEVNRSPAAFRGRTVGKTAKDKISHAAAAQNGKRKEERSSVCQSKGKNVTTRDRKSFCFDSVRAAVADPLIRALFHLHNRQTELLQKVVSEVSEISSRQKEMCDALQKLQSVSCGRAVQTTCEASVVNHCVHMCNNCKRYSEKCTQTSRLEDKSVQSTGDTCTQTVLPVRSENRGEATKTSSGGADAGTWSEDICEMSGKFDAVTISPPKDERDRVQNVRSSGRSQSRGGETRCSSKGKAATSTNHCEGPSQLSEKEDSRGAGSLRDSRSLVKNMKNLASRYRNSDVIKAPQLEDVAEASETSLESEDGSASEAADESLTIGDLSLVPQNVSMTPDPSFHIDMRGLEMSTDTIDDGSDDSEAEGSAYGAQENGVDTTTVYLYKNLIRKVQEILDHSKTAPERRRNSSGKELTEAEPRNQRIKTRTH